MYALRSTTPVRKSQKKVKDVHLKMALIQAFESIAEDPYLGEAKKGDLAGIYTCRFVYHAVQYRIAYTIKPETQTVLLLFVGKREGFYEQLKQYMN